VSVQYPPRNLLEKIEKDIGPYSVDDIVRIASTEGYTTIHKDGDDIIAILSRQSYSSDNILFRLGSQYECIHLTNGVCYAWSPVCRSWIKI